ncbi:hypothetical protein QBZ16_002170 [Prototheca wickerhamii]|uniref:UmuC domain-containing protein n=1 Tax=Prototheca wickerhamii TaxID=3111 RepID=A0AAD9IN16_PROWI|nr:hypothetical protein QBZ16_002170 [Prototheca wickerhamii]
MSEARSKGVKRNMRGDEAVKLCPALKLVQVPTAHGKADLTLYRRAGARVLAVLAGPATACERASIDEAYLDITEAAAAELAASGGPPFAAPHDAARILVVGTGADQGQCAWWWCF